MDMQMYVGGLITDIYSQLGERNEAFRTKYGDGTYTCPGLLFSVRIRAQYLRKDSNGERDEVDKYVHIILAGNTVHVWVAVSEEWDPWRIPWSEWDNTSNHDSCWRSDGVHTPIAQVYFKVCDEVQAGIPEDKKVAPAQINVHAKLGFLRPFTAVRVEFTANSDRNARLGRYLIRSVTQADATYQLGAEG